MRHVRISTRASLASMLTAIVLCGLWPLAAAAAPLDHRTCSRVIDSSKASTAVDLETLPFGLDSDCVVRVTARQLCAPADADSMATSGDSVAVEGPELTEEQVCYRIECPQRAARQVEVTDRFGARTVSVMQPRIWCVPARAPAVRDGRE